MPPSLPYDDADGDLQGSPSHEIVRSLWKALRLLGVDPRPSDVERWGLSVHCALSAMARQFHSHEHVMGLADGVAPLEVIAALYHDVVYVQVDGELPGSMSELLSPLLERQDAGWAIRDAALATPATRNVLAVFGRRPGDVLGPTSGLNELASAFVVALHLGELLPHDAIVAIAACIEATIPFRADPGGLLAARLAALGIPEPRVAEHVERAMRVANGDVENFADDDAARFLANTWKLLPETNPALHVPARYTVGDYRMALMKMETFLKHLPAERVFHVWGNEPSRAEHERTTEAARRNISIAVRYLRVKLYAIALIEAMCLETGGDLPLQYVMGELASAGGRRPRLEQFLPTPTAAANDEAAPDALLHRLLAGGRSGTSTFDIAPSPLATHLLVALGEARIELGVADARKFWSGATTAREFLFNQRGAVVASLVRAAAELAGTRREPLLALAASLSPSSAGTPRYDATHIRSELVPFEFDSPVVGPRASRFAPLAND